MSWFSKTRSEIQQGEVHSPYLQQDPIRLAEVAGAMLLRAAGENLDREGLQKTPARFSAAMRDLTEGYRATPAEVVGEGIFKAESGGLVSVCDIEFFSLCEHHLLPFWGKASVAYFPGEKILGLSKIPRLVDLYARRFQVQERMTQQVVDAISALIRPRAVAVRVSAGHLCMMMRGVEKQHSHTVTEASSGLERLTEGEVKRLWGAAALESDHPRF